MTSNNLKVFLLVSLMFSCVIAVSWPNNNRKKDCAMLNCMGKQSPVCGHIKRNNEKTFENECEMNKYNCEKDEGEFNHIFKRFLISSEFSF